MHCLGLHFHGEDAGDDAVVLEDEELTVGQAGVLVVVHRAGPAADLRDIVTIGGVDQGDDGRDVGCGSGAKCGHSVCCVQLCEG